MAGERVTMSSRPSVPARRLRSVRTMVSSSSSFMRVAQRDDQALGRDGFDEEVDGALAHRRDDGFERGMGGLDDDGRSDAVARHGFHDRHAVAVGHDEIEDDGAEAGVRRA